MDFAFRRSVCLIETARACETVARIIIGSEGLRPSVRRLLNLPANTKRWVGVHRTDKNGADNPVIQTAVKLTNQARNSSGGQANSGIRTRVRPGTLPAQVAIVGLRQRSASCCCLKTAFEYRKNRLIPARFFRSRLQDSTFDSVQIGSTMSSQLPSRECPEKIRTEKPSRPLDNNSSFREGIDNKSCARFRPLTTFSLSTYQPRAGAAGDRAQIVREVSSVWARRRHDPTNCARDFSPDLPPAACHLPAGPIRQLAC
jgi:hypothetical protein